MGGVGGATYAQVVSKRRIGSRTTTSSVHTITSAQGPLGEDIDRRARRYLAQMAVRTICFLSAVATWGRIPTWMSVTLLIGAVILPYVAVVLANAGRERPDRADSFLELREIGGAPLHPPVGAPTPFPPADPGPPLSTPGHRASWTAGPDGVGRE